MQNNWSGVLTGKGLSWGGSLIRPEATGYGCVYYTEKMIERATNGKESFKGKRVAISGSGNVAQFAALKVIELGGVVVSLSTPRVQSFPRMVSLLNKLMLLLLLN